jgi:hypothetical protein
MWINCNNQLPPKSVYVLTYGLRDSSLGYYNAMFMYVVTMRDVFGWVSLPDNYKPFHWMPLPEPPKGV